MKNKQNYLKLNEERNKRISAALANFQRLKKLLEIQLNKEDKKKEYTGNKNNPYSIEKKLGNLNKKMDGRNQL